MTSRTSELRKRSNPYQIISAKRLPKVIPPRSLVVLARFDPKRSPSWVDQRGRLFRIGYYNPNDGLDCVWLVNDAGEYKQTIDQASISENFVVLKLSKESDLFGKRRRQLKALGRADLPTYVLAEV